MSYTKKLLKTSQIDAFQHVLNSMFFPFYTTAGFDYLCLSLDGKPHHSLYKFYIKFTLFCLFLFLSFIFYATRNSRILIAVIVFSIILGIWDILRLWSVSYSILFNKNFNRFDFLKVNYKKDTLEMAAKLTYARLILYIIYIVGSGISINKYWPQLYQDIKTTYPNTEE